MKREDYEKRLEKLQRKLTLLQQAYARQGHRGIIVLEGWDAAGKGGLVRRLSWCLDPRRFRVWATTAPSPAERRQHWLQRFWRNIPESGTIAAFDRSWYGRVLVERVEGFATEPEWQRAYSEIGDFERTLVAEDFRIVKLFLDITPQTQLDRFQERYETRSKRWKLTEEDLRNRDKWQDYEAAYKDMLERCNNDGAPWTKIDMNDKRQGRLDAFETIRERLSQSVDMADPEIPDAVEAFFSR